MPLHHFSVYVPETKVEDVVAFLLSSLKHLGFKEMLRPVDKVVGMGESKPYFWIIGLGTEGLDTQTFATLTRQAHVAFAATDIQGVRKFHAEGLKAGGIDNGKPGHRPEYHPGYYGAFVRDPACNINFEVVFSGCPEDAELLKKMEEEADA